MASSDEHIVVVAATRLPQARQKGALSSCSPLTLASNVAARTLQYGQVSPGCVDQVYWGMMYQTEGDTVYLARHAALIAGIPESTPAVLANRLCGSGVSALIDGARCIRLGEARVVLTGTTDTISRCSSIHFSSPLLPPELADKDPVFASTYDGFCGKTMAQLAESFAVSEGIERQQLDDYAFLSRNHCEMANESGFLHRELNNGINSKEVNGPVQDLPVHSDQLERRWQTRNSLLELQSPFGRDGRLTRGNTSAFADGAAALIIADGRIATANGWRKLARLHSWAITAANPNKIGYALVSAVRVALERADLAIADVDWFDLEEAFSVYCIYAIQELQVSPEKVNPWGGALALGHAPATSGLRSVIAAIHGLHALNGRFAVVGVGMGTSQGIALVLERIVD